MPTRPRVDRVSLVSWKTFLHAANLRGDSRIADLNASKPRGVFHCRCYQTYTLKFYLARVSERRLGQCDSSSMNPAFCSSVYKLERSSTMTAADLSSDQTSAAPPRSSRSTPQQQQEDLLGNVCSVRLLTKGLETILANTER